MARRVRAAGWVHRQEDLAAVAAAVEAVVAGRRPRTAGLPAQALAATPDPTGLLTGRESDVLAGMVRGDDNKAIAADLLISPHTVRTHAQSIFAKLGVRSRLAAIAVGRESGFGAIADARNAS
jgi:DNA-binding NarL/FixJ family response regulator